MQVKETKNYEMFNQVQGNRTKNQLHLNRLKESMEEYLLVSPIIVNQEYEVIDGQHRLHVSKELGLPVRYIQVDGYGLDEVHRYNQNSKNWKIEEFVDGYASMGYKDYQYLQQFSHDKLIGISIATSLLTTNNGRQYQKIKDGTWKITNKEKGNVVADWIAITKQYYDGSGRKTFALALSQLYDNENFEFSHFISKMNLQPNSIVHCANVGQYIALIESIYNYHSRNKVNLRF